jgi:hypothetical protein
MQLPDHDTIAAMRRFINAPTFFPQRCGPSSASDSNGSPESLRRSISSSRRRLSRGDPQHRHPLHADTDAGVVMCDWDLFGQRDELIACIPAAAGDVP